MVNGLIMKIIFIMPSVGRKKGKKYLKTWQMEPLPIAQIAGLTPKNITKIFFDDRLEEIDYTETADLVAITVETYTAKRAYEIASQYRARGIKVVLGGFHPTLMPDEALEYADAVVVGEAEGQWQKLLMDFQVGNLKKIYKSEQRPSLINIKADRSIFKGKKYLPIALVETARGCKFACQFCSISAFYKKTYNTRPIAEVIEEIKNLKVKTVFFIDDNIVADTQRSIEFFNALIPLKINWVSQVSINIAQDEGMLELMKKSGCIGVLIGFESLDSLNLKQMNKSWNKQVINYELALDRFRKHNIVIYATFLFGYDNDDIDLMKKTLRFGVKQKFFLAAFNHLVPFPGTAIYDSLKNQGRLLYNKWWLDGDYYFGDIAYQPNKMSPQELAAACVKFRKDFYSLKSIGRRAFKSKSNCHGLLRFSNFLMLNLLFRKEVLQRKGLPLGQK